MVPSSVEAGVTGRLMTFGEPTVVSVHIYCLSCPRSRVTAGGTSETSRDLGDSGRTIVCVRLSEDGGTTEWVLAD